MPLAVLDPLLATRNAAIAADLSPRAKPLPLGQGRSGVPGAPAEGALPEAVSALLPDGGLLRGGVVEIAAARGLA